MLCFGINQKQSIFVTSTNFPFRWLSKGRSSWSKYDSAFVLIFSSDWNLALSGLWMNSKYSLNFLESFLITLCSANAGTWNWTLKSSVGRFLHFIDMRVKLSGFRWIIKLPSEIQVHQLTSIILGNLIGNVHFAMCTYAFASVCGKVMMLTLECTSLCYICVCSS